MARTVQKVGERGSLRWIQTAVADRWPSLEAPILAHLPPGQDIHWRSPLAADTFAEYSDGDFLDLVGLPQLRPALADFWPERGPQWDALATFGSGGVLLGEAKAHVGELCTPGTGAGEASRRRIAACLDAVADHLGAKSTRAPWTTHFYQLANRLAFLHFLRSNDVDARLVLVNFIGDTDMNGPSTPEAWHAAYAVALHAMGLGKRHHLSRYIIHAYPDVARGGA